MVSSFHSKVNLSLLNTFVIVAEKKKISVASRVLKLSQPAVTAQIHKLEEQIGTSLFARSIRGVALTKEGELFYGSVKKILDLIEKSIQEVSKSEDPEEHLSILASRTLGSHVLPSFVMAFAKRHPKITCQLSIVNTETAIQRVREAKDTFAMVEGFSRAVGVSTKRFFSDALLPVASPEIALKIKDSKGLKSHPVLWREKGSGTRDVIEKALLKYGYSKKDLVPLFEFESSEAIISGLREGVGIGFLSRWSLEDDLNLGRLKIIALPNFTMKRDFSWILPPQGLSGISAIFFDFAEKLKVERGYSY
ncbi:MAG: LysR family transcriptional regulator [Proteobacteria bacterium]|nr:MAG: LysR family transcriptional regulator [Pseudomonadota bacterium]